MSNNINSFKNKLLEYFLNEWGMFEYRRGWLKGTCPYCNKEFKFGINLSLNRANCFYCGPHGKPLEVVEFIEKVDKAKAIKVVSSKEGISFKEFKYKPIEFNRIEFPSYFRLLSEGSSRLAKEARKYMEGRGFSINELVLKGVGYCYDGKYMGYIIIPFFYDDQLVYYNARKFFGIGPKFDNPTVEDVGIGKNLVMYNRDCLDFLDEVNLVESAINALTLGEDTAAFGGKAVSPWQLSEVIKSPTEHINIILDPDAMVQAIKLGLSILPHKKSIKIVELPPGEDVNSLGKKETLKFIKRAEYDTNYSKLLLKLKRYEKRPRITCD